MAKKEKSVSELLEQVQDILAEIQDKVNENDSDWSDEDENENEDEE
jgi:uncharacterized spore protein YtfJ